MCCASRTVSATPFFFLLVRVSLTFFVFLSTLLPCICVGGPDRYKLLRWLYLRFQEIPDNGEKATVVTEERLQDWVGMMGMPKLAVNSTVVREFSGVQKKVVDDLKYLLQLVETIKAYNNGSSKQNDEALMELVTSNIKEMFSTDFNLFPQDILDAAERETAPADLIDADGNYKHENLEGLKNTLHEMKLKTVELERQLEKVKKGDLKRKPPASEIKKVVELRNGPLNTELLKLHKNMAELESLNLPTEIITSNAKEFNVGPALQRTNEDLAGILTLLDNLKQTRENIDSLVYAIGSQDKNTSAAHVRDGILC